MFKSLLNARAPKRRKAYFNPSVVAPFIGAFVLVHCVGKKNAKTRAQIVATLSESEALTQELRQVIKNATAKEFRDCIEFLRKRRVLGQDGSNLGLICSTSGGRAGYYYPTNFEEFKGGLRSLCQRANTQVDTIRAMLASAVISYGKNYQQGFISNITALDAPLSLDSKGRAWIWFWKYISQLPSQSITDAARFDVLVDVIARLFAHLREAKK